MEAVNKITTNKQDKPQTITFRAEDKSAMEHMKYAQGLGASLRYANELRAVQQIGRLPSLRSSHLHEDVLKGRLGAGSCYDDLLKAEDF